MKRVILPLLIACAGCFSSAAQATFDKALADSLGADQYGMKMYFLVILKTGSDQITDGGAF